MSDETIRFHVDRRGRILIENVTAAALALARALAPEDPALAAVPEPSPRRADDAPRRR